MRLTTIKLSGFKSFAEPSQFQLPGQLIAVVGPNGCGKSNIIDAVRWVLGESRASELRGESMQDVIFSGTETRKPASRASVELVFDNSDHRASGQWNQYAEIAVKRVLTRDGSSSYMINGQIVRRRDVQDVFLGTGLGPRAYAIIGQGTISRIIESRPEEMRLFLEEAAGVSKYKERRRETENRLVGTHENLTRVEDILRELNNNIDRLEKQAKVAQRYHELKDKAGLRQQQFWLLKQKEAQHEGQNIALQIVQAQTALDERISEQRKTESDLETIRQAHYAAGDAVNQAQGKLYEASANVAKLEAQIKFVVDGRNRSQQRIAEMAVQLSTWQDRQTQAQMEIESITEQMAVAEESALTLAAQCEEDGERTPALEEDLRNKQNKAAIQRNNVLQVQQQIQLLAAEQRMLDEQLRALQLRQERLNTDKKQLSLPNQEHLVRLKEQLLQAQEQQEIANAQFEELSQSVPEFSAKCDAEKLLLSTETAKQTGLDARLQALKALQEKVQTDGKLQPWLQKQGLDSLSALWHRVHVELGWEGALESALREKLSALEVGQLDRLSGFVNDLPPTRLTFYSPMLVSMPENANGKKPLSSKLKVNDPTLKALLTDWLHGCWIAENLDEALKQREQLTAGEAFYVPAGHSVTRNSMSFYAADSEQAGMLARQQEIENIEKQIKAQALIVDQVRASLVRAESAFHQTQQRFTSSREEVQRLQNRVHQLQVEVLQLAQQAESAEQRHKQLSVDLEEVTIQIEGLAENKGAAEGRFEELDLSLAQEQEAQARLDEDVMLAEQALAQGREQRRILEHRAQEAQFSVRSLLSRQQELNRAIETAVQQIGSLTAENNRIQEELAQFDDAAAQTGLQDALEVKTECEEILSGARIEYEDLTQRLRTMDERRMQIIQALEPMRQQVTELQFKEQAVQIGIVQYTQQLDEAGADCEALLQSIENEELKLQDLQPEIDRLQQSLNALGAVNLAAFEELEQSLQRKKFLDAQIADLNKAITTLEGAIIKIDKQTRDLLISTFNAVNDHFGRMFPELFGGGNAKLMMVGDEILDSGVQVMAQPPGKRNSTIHLLSGGEKALTAIALVFAIFQLNPAPFCLLDEVDAPLDDANTERYARLVTRMSEETQFLFISHNKIAMEMAEQLIGVTMQEQGVSRIVAVDMQEALSMAKM